jgi:hypothetical protein
MQVNSSPPERVLHIFFKTFRRRQKIFTTNNHYEWSKQPVASEMLSLIHVVVQEFVIAQQRVIIIKIIF